MTDIPILVAHRGYPARYPENTLEGICAALESGACFVEFDVQFSADGVPVLIHDDNLRRTAGIDLRVPDTKLAELKRVSIGEPARFGGTFADTRMPTLEEALALLRQWPKATAFVEIKRASLRRFGRPAVVPSVLDVLRPALDQCVVISFDSEAIAQVRRSGVDRIGWALEAWTGEQREIATRLSPDYLFCKVGRLPAQSQPLWPGPWTWVAYETSAPQLALDLAARGIGFVETDAIGEMLCDPVLKRKACGRG